MCCRAIKGEAVRDGGEGKSFYKLIERPIKESHVKSAIQNLIVLFIGHQGVKGTSSSLSLLLMGRQLVP